MSFEQLTIRSTCLYVLNNDGPKNTKALFLECQAHLDPSPSPSEVITELNLMVEQGLLEIVVTPTDPKQDPVYGVKLK